MKIYDVTEEYFNNAKPDSGIIEHDDKSEISDREMSELLHKTFGGNIRTLAPELVNGKNVKTPDALWDGIYWEYKSISSKLSVETRLRVAWHQLRENAERKGMQGTRIGVVLNISERKQSLNDTVDFICQVFEKKVLYPADMILIEKGKVIKVLRK